MAESQGLVAGGSAQIVAEVGQVRRGVQASSTAVPNNRISAIGGHSKIPLKLEIGVCPHFQLLLLKLSPSVVQYFTV